MLHSFLTTKNKIWLHGLYHWHLATKNLHVIVAKCERPLSVPWSRWLFKAKMTLKCVWLDGFNRSIFGSNFFNTLAKWEYYHLIRQIEKTEFRENVICQFQLTFLPKGLIDLIWHISNKSNRSSHLVWHAHSHWPKTNTFSSNSPSDEPFTFLYKERTRNRWSEQNSPSHRCSITV